MITITLLGTDPYLLKQLSKELTPVLANLYECKKDDIDFFAPEGFLVHDGVEQNSWNLLVKVEAPSKVKVLENKVATVLHKYIVDVIATNIEIRFSYYSLENRYTYINKESPRFVTEENSVYVDDDDDCECENEEGEEPYLGDAFEEFNAKMGNLK